ncbi:MAG: asparagine synthase (glutamine-hydrolyzing) [Candidatus Acidiferrales bacterium]
MCGIAGFWQTTRGPEHPLEILSRMADSLVHRGPDDSGTFHDGASGVGLAFRRLAILDLSPQGHQPMHSASGRYVIIFNGEIYNCEEIRAEIGGHSWRGHSDTEVMLQAIERGGLDAAVRRFAGMFAFALWDRRERQLSLCRDRIGIKPLYYGRAGSAFVFASELKAIAQHPDFQGEIDRNALALYMRHSYVPAPHCIYKGLYKLEPGCILTLTSAAASPEIHHYWSAREAAVRGLQSPLDVSDADAIQQLHEKLSSAVRQRMFADVPLGAFLSGGIDSSTVVALMQAQSTQPVKTFTIGFHDDGYNEAKQASQIAAHLKTDHTELYLTPDDALDVVPLLPTMYDEPFADSSQIPTHLISALARQKVTVSLSGDGGDEVFGGYNRYLFTKRTWRLLSRLPVPLRDAMASLLQALRPTLVDRAFRNINPFVPARLRLTTPADKFHKLAALCRAKTIEAAYFQTLSHCDDPTEVVLHSREPTDTLDSISDASRVANIEEAMMLTDLSRYLPDDILVKLDRASMANSLEARVPLLDHRVVEFAWRLPLHFKIRNGTSKWILRQILYRYVPEKLIERPKMGFAVPIDRWLRGPLRPWAEDLLSETRLSERGLLNANRIRMRWRQHLAGERNWQGFLWNVLVFQDWLRHSVPAIPHNDPPRAVAATTSY